MERISFEGNRIIPRDFFHALLEPKIKAKRKYKDICLIKVLVRGLKDGEPYEYVAELIDKYDEKTGFTSMERVTGWHTAIMLEMAIQGKAKKGVHGLETAVNPAEFIAEAKKRGFTITEQLYPVSSNDGMR